MRIVLDLQGAQSANRKRGIGRYCVSLAQAIVRNRGEHEVLIALNGALAESVEPIRTAFESLLPQEAIRVWEAPAGLLGGAGSPAGELLREAFLAGLKPDVLHVSSLFEGFDDAATTSVSALSGDIPTAVTLYDLIPHLYPEHYLVDPAMKAWYEGKLAHLRRADRLLAISDSSRLEALGLGLPPERVLTISTAAEAHFRPRAVAPAAEAALRRRYGLDRPFVMYTGGIDHRKNIEGLIRAYAALPAALRQAHRLAVVCKAAPHEREALTRLAKQRGLAEGELVLTDYVPEEDLIDLYNLCKLFVFPSWHEGFGLPALEAMACGAPVIAANTASLPEVVGREDALFDPRSESAIAAKLHQALEDEPFRRELAAHGLEQARRFSWDACGKRALEAFEALHAERSARPAPEAPARLKLAYVSPLPPDRTGIADYSAELLPELAKHYDVTVVTPQAEIADPWVREHCAHQPPEWLRQNAHRIDRVLYHFGNSQFHAHMFDLLPEVPGAVVLHDFFLSGIQRHRELHRGVANAWSQELYRAHGYAALRENFHANDNAEVEWAYPVNLSVLQQAKGVIVHSPHALRLARDWYGEAFVDDWASIPLLRETPKQVERQAARQALGLAEDDLLVCSFGLLGPTKLNHRLLEAWLETSLAKNPRASLVFVGENHPGAYGAELAQAIRKRGVKNRIRITGWTDGETFKRYLAAADVAVQLRTLSRGETSAAVLDCMAHGVATIVNAHGALADLPEEAVLRIPDAFETGALASALEALGTDPEQRRALAERGRAIARRAHAPGACATRYHQAIEQAYARDALGQLLPALGALTGFSPAEHELLELARTLASNHPAKAPTRQLLVDVSELVQQDARTGIQRVTRSILKQLLENPPEGYRVEPVYATPESGYRYARRFTLGFLDCPADVLTDEPIEYRAGDRFLGLDLQHHVVSGNEAFYQALRRQGVLVQFVVYDLLCIRQPQFFVPGAAELHARWLSVVAQADGAICISKAVADDLEAWLAEQPQAPRRPFAISWFHLGADIDSSAPTRGLSPDAPQVLARLQEAPAFLMVGTVEPRKGHAQALAAFEQLWAEGGETTLVVVGKQGWMVEALAEKLRRHPELGRRLFWLEGISDEYLERVYAQATCLIAASEGEGFGLPLIEAAQRGLPLIARSLPVFREVAGEHALYFDGPGPEALAEAVTAFLARRARGEELGSGGMPWLTWRESAERLKPLATGAR